MFSSNKPQNPSSDSALPVTSTTADSWAVECRGITKEFGSGNTRIRVLHGIDFQVRYGELTFLLGPSGCGKTTLISIIGGLLTPNAGSVVAFNTDMRKLSGGRLADFRSNNIGFIFQQFNLLPTLTAAENVAVSLLIRGCPYSSSVAKANKLLDALEMSAHANKLPKQLSGGQQQRVAIARAVVHDPSLVICDEPTASLDATSGQQVMELLRNVSKQSQRAVLVVTHDNRILSFADTISTMADGRITKTEKVMQPTNANPVAPADSNDLNH